ncbi:hypothetical protein BC831DRAFT_441628 [Entophlyctis helioformis]|nr:hypothetical protein BC831DRAFT_441628 [Entophlyctis helioformis]
METLEEIKSRHRREAKELTAKVTGLKKAIGKGAADKKKKKEVQDQIAALEAELLDRHQKELASLEASVSAAPLGTEVDTAASADRPAVDAVDAASAEMETMTISASGADFKKSKQAKRKERKAAQYEEMRREAEAEAALAPNLKEIENAELDRIIAEMSLSIKEISADGHCLYNALADQLRLHDPSSDKTYKQLREMAADYMRSHADDFIPFLTNDNGDMLTESEFKEYCQNVESSAVWGGQLEIQALSQALRRQIQIVQRGSPLLKVGEEFGNHKPLMVSYHRHAYGLGEHYNSLTPR